MSTFAWVVMAVFLVNAVFFCKDVYQLKDLREVKFRALAAIGSFLAMAGTYVFLIQPSEPVLWFAWMVFIIFIAYTVYFASHAFRAKRIEDVRWKFVGMIIGALMALLTYVAIIAPASY